jgi:hypothetical protein
MKRVIATGSLAVIAGALAIVLVLMAQWRVEDQARATRWDKEDRARTTESARQAANHAAYERCVLQSGPSVCSLAFIGVR